MVEVFGSDWPDDAYIDARLRRLEFNLQVWRWSEANRKKLRRALEAMVVPPQSARGGAPWDTPEIMQATEEVFRTFALRQGLLTQEFFQQPQHAIPCVDPCGTKSHGTNEDSSTSRVKHAMATCGSADANFEVDWNRFMGNGVYAADYRATVKWRMKQIVKKERKLHAMITHDLGKLEGVDRELVRPVSRFEGMMPVSWEAWGRIHRLYKAAQAGPLDHRHANARTTVLQYWKNALGVPDFR